MEILQKSVEKSIAGVIQRRSFSLSKLFDPGESWSGATNQELIECREVICPDTFAISRNYQRPPLH
jgi:hypothetical protein